MDEGKKTMAFLPAVAAAAAPAEGIVSDITTAAGEMKTELLAVGALGVVISLALMVYPRAIAFFKKTAKP